MQVNKLAAEFMIYIRRLGDGDLYSKRPHALHRLCAIAHGEAIGFGIGAAIRAVAHGKFIDNCELSTPEMFLSAIAEWACPTPCGAMLLPWPADYKSAHLKCLTRVADCSLLRLPEPV